MGNERSGSQPHETYTHHLLAQYVGDRRVVRVIPNIIKSTLEAQCIIGQRELSNGSIGTLEVELVAHPLRQSPRS